MVFFTCNGCGESLKRAQIPKHGGMCRGARVFSCIDCGTDFHGEDYKSHMKCISEDQKYGGKNYEAKANKGDVKQQQWIQRIQEVLSKPGVNGRLKSVLQQVASYDNVPRKKVKFQNWMKNSLRIYDGNLQDQVWEIFSSIDASLCPAHPVNVPQTNGVERANNLQQPEAPVEQNESQKPEQLKKNKRERKEERQQKRKKKRTENSGEENQQDGENGVEERQRKKKKRKRGAEEFEEEENEEKTTTRIKKTKKNGGKREAESLETEDDEQGVNEKTSSKDKFNWKGTIKAVLRQAPEEGISVKKLRKKVLSAYCAHSGESNFKSEEELYTLFNKKLKNPKFRMLKDKVKLIQ